MEITEAKKMIMITPPAVREPAPKPSKKTEPPSDERVNDDEKITEFVERIAAGKDKAVQDLVENLNQFMKSMRFSLRFIPNMESGRAVIKVLNGDGKVIRQIPPEAMIALSSRFGADIGLLVNIKL
ncbi:MAG: flagellar protein FlaG [Deltaproteobacteria bacterium]|nr:flagellar protein FlaG [Deltaproteobacteria bacterium]